MNLYDVYPLFDVVPVHAQGHTVTDEDGKKYMDFYGGHAVISIGHQHPHYVHRLKEQLDKIAFYSNSIQNPLQSELAQKLGTLSSCNDYNLFLSNSGAEANENALKVASFVTGKKEVIAFTDGFHGRTSAAVAATDNPSIKAPLNQQQVARIVDFEDVEAFDTYMQSGDVCAVIIEAIQGVGGLSSPTVGFYQHIARECKKHNVLLIADEVQSGYGRTGKFFGFQHYDIEPDIITIAKGMGNGFPIGGTLIHDRYKAKYGQLGTTFGGNHLACTAGLAVLEVIEKEDLVSNAHQVGAYFRQKASELAPVEEIKGKGLMVGLSFGFPIAELRKKLIFEEGLFTGSSKNKNQLRILPPLNITTTDVDAFFDKLNNQL